MGKHLKVQKTIYIYCKLIWSDLYSNWTGRRVLFAKRDNRWTVTVSYLHQPAIHRNDPQLTVGNLYKVRMQQLSPDLCRSFDVHPPIPNSQHISIYPFAGQKINRDKQPLACFSYTPLFRNHGPFNCWGRYNPLINHLKSAINDSSHIPQIWPSKPPNVM